MLKQIKLKYENSEVDWFPNKTLVMDYEYGLRFFEDSEILVIGDKFWDIELEPDDLSSKRNEKTWTQMGEFRRDFFKIGKYSIFPAVKGIKFLIEFWNRVEKKSKNIELKTNWERRRFRFENRLEPTDSFNLYKFSKGMIDDSERTKRKLSKDWTKQYIDAMGINLGFYNYLGEEMKDSSPNDHGLSRKLFLELEYYEGNDNPEDYVPANLYLGCLYTVIEEGRLSEEDYIGVRYSVPNEIKELNLKKGEMIETRVKIASSANPINWEDCLDWETCEHTDFQQLFSPSNAFSDNRFIEREVLRSFRTIFEHTNNIFTDNTKTSGKDIPEYLFYEGENNQWSWDLKIDRLDKCFKREYNLEQLDRIRIHYRKRLLRGLGWNVDES